MRKPFLNALCVTLVTVAALVLGASSASAQQHPKKKKKNQTVQIENGALKLPGPVVFETGTDKLKVESEPVLDIVKDHLDAKPRVTMVRIEGHTDTDGSAAANQKLSEGRALTVAKWLTARGISCTRLLAVGFGATKPIAPNDTQENKAKNRRLAFVYAQLNGKAIGGMPPDGGGRVAGDPCQ